MRAGSEQTRPTDGPHVRVLSPGGQLNALGRTSTRKLILKKASTHVVTEKPLQLPKGILKGVRPKKIVITSKPTETKVQRPHTPEQRLSQCLDCDNVKDFMAALQGEIKRLQVSHFS